MQLTYRFVHPVIRQLVPRPDVAGSWWAGGTAQVILPFRRHKVLHRLHSVAKGRSGFDPDLARIVGAWPTLPEPIRRAMLALVEAIR